LTEAQVFPQDFQACIDFHGHVCPGLAIGYAAVKAGEQELDLGRSEDEEIVAIVENDSCAVDAIQVLLGCTFGKGNLIFRDWGKQVYTFFERESGRAVRVVLAGRELPGREERHALKEKIDAGLADDEDRRRWEELRNASVIEMISSDPKTWFKIEKVDEKMPPPARIVSTSPCDICGEETVSSKLLNHDSGRICPGCAQVDG
jgi:formylmethanofuran dehydrogenase subunit E